MNKLKTKVGAALVGVTALGAGAFLAPTANAQIEPASPETIVIEDGEQLDRATARADRMAERFQALVDNGTISQEQADLIADQIASGDFGQRGDGEGRNHGKHGKRGHHGIDASVVTDLLGLTEDELRTELAAGNTLAEVAEANGVGTDALTATLETAANDAIDAALADGKITAEQADEKRAEIAEKIESRINETKSDDDGEGRRGHRGHRGDRSATDADADAPA